MKLNRLSKTALCVAVPTAAVTPVVVTSCCDKGGDDRPNVIFILMDDAGYGDFGCYGQTKTETPNIMHWLKTVFDLQICTPQHLYPLRRAAV